MGHLPLRIKRRADVSLHKEIHREVEWYGGNGIPDIHPNSVSLNPGGHDYADSELRQLKVWFSGKDKSSWSDFHQVLGDLAPLGRIVFTIGGNKTGASYWLGTSPQCTETAVHVLTKHFPNILTEEADLAQAITPYAGLSFHIGDLRPASGYLGRLKAPPPSAPSPMAAAILALMNLDASEYGYVEVVIQADPGSFRRQLRTFMIMAEESSKLGISGRVPGYSLEYDFNVAEGARAKLKDAGPVFYSSWRCGLFGHSTAVLSSVIAAIRTLTFNNECFRILTEEDYRKVLGRPLQYQDVSHGQVYGPGLPLTAQELSAPIHFPTNEMLNNPHFRFDRLQGLAYRGCEDNSGIQFGLNKYGSRSVPVIQADHLRDKHTAVLGATGMGKSWFLAGAVLQVMEK